MCSKDDKFSNIQINNEIEYKIVIKEDCNKDDSTFTSASSQITIDNSLNTSLRNLKRNKFIKIQHSLTSNFF